jgi:DNA-binding CsgD family transcriptional regulator
MLLATGRPDEAETWASSYLKQVRHLPQKDQIVLMLAYIWLERGELPMVRSWLRDVGPRPWPWADQFGNINPQMLAIDLHLADGDVEEADRKARLAVDEARSLRRWAEFIGLSLRLAITRRELGRREEASAHLVETLRRGLKGGFVRSFNVSGFALPTVFREDWDRIRRVPGISEHIHLLGDAIAGEDRLLLTRREAEVLVLVAEGKSNKEIADMLFISVNTVRNHLVRMGKRLRTGSRTELVARARRVGILD